MHRVKVVRHLVRDDGGEVVELSDGSSIEVDLCIATTGDKANTGFLPIDWLDQETGKVRCDPQSLKVDGRDAEEVFAFGSVTSISDGSFNADIRSGKAAVLESLRLSFMGQGKYTVLYKLYD